MRTISDILDFLDDDSKPIKRQELTDAIRRVFHDLSVRTASEPVQNEGARLWGRVFAAAYESDPNYDNAHATANAVLKTFEAISDRTKP